MSYNIEFTKSAMKFIKKQDKPTKTRLLQAIYNLPRGDVVKIQGSDNKHRLRIGNFRVIYQIIESILLIDVLAVGNRGNVYDNI